MNSMASPSLVRDVQRLSRTLSQVLKLLPGDEKRIARGKKSASVLFELKVLFSLLAELKEHFQVEVVSPPGKDFHFCRAPAAKASATYFRLKRSGNEYHLTHGTKIRDRHDQDRAPDLSLQEASAANDPEWRHVLAIWDAKLRGTSAAPSARRISDGEYARFAKVRAWLDEIPPRPIDDVLDLFPPAFEVCSLITNGQGPSEPPNVLFEDRVSIVEHFADARQPCKPTRREHAAHKP